jgi:hypothetical protein
MLFDSMVPNIGSLLDESYLHMANCVHYDGANAGRETFQTMSCWFDGQRIVSNGVLALKEFEESLSPGKASGP